MSLRAGRAGVIKNSVNPISGKVEVQLPSDIDAKTVNTVGIRVNPDDAEKIQFKTPSGEWQDFSSGGGDATLLWEDLTIASVPYAGMDIAVDSTGYSIIIVLTKGYTGSWIKDGIGYFNKIDIPSLKPFLNFIFYRHGNNTIAYSELTVTDSNVHIGVAHTDTTSWTTDRNVPYRIYGIK